MTVPGRWSGDDEAVPLCPPTEQPTTILLVEHDLLVRPTFVRVLLRRSCDRVIEAGSAEIALYLCGAHSIDLVAVTARLPGLGAEGLCAELRHGGGPPIVAYRMGVDADHHIRWADAGGADALSGDDPVLLAARCRAVLRRGRSRSTPLPFPWHHHVD